MQNVVTVFRILIYQKRHIFVHFFIRNPEQCGLFIDVLNSKTRTYDLLPLQRRIPEKK